jgi:intein-encoded DNA endonuclease-like protein
MEDKSFKIKFPEWLDKKLWNHFIRGYFDGDGGICISKNSLYKSNLNITSNFEFMNQIQEILIKECNINKTKLNKKGNVYILNVSGKFQLSRVLKYIYNDSHIFLQRKYDKMQKLIELKIVNLEETNIGK